MIGLVSQLLEINKFGILADKSFSCELSVNQFPKF